MPSQNTLFMVLFCKTSKYNTQTHEKTNTQLTSKPQTYGRAASVMNDIAYNY